MDRKKRICSKRLIIDPGSFRDPSGFIFYVDNTVYRSVSEHGSHNYDLLKSSGFYDKAIRKNLLISHTEVNDFPDTVSAYKVLEPEKIEFISYPYEWCFSQLKDAALLTIRLQRQAIDSGFSLKDASAYNIQFKDGAPLFIDTLSFEPYREGDPWVAYRQYCQHFLGPLAAMAFTHIDLIGLLRANLDGLNTRLVSRLLPVKTIFKFPLLTHIHMHAHSETTHTKQSDRLDTVREKRFSRNAMHGLIDSLESAVEGLSWEPANTIWGDYYNDTNYSEQALAAKKDIVERLIHSAEPRDVWDLGANTGLFSRIASDRKIRTIAFDIDPAAVEKNYRKVRKENEKFILPLVMDLANPSPGLGWDHAERQALVSRGPADLLLALALIHHLAISNNLPLRKIAETFSKLGQHLVIEFVPKSDSQVKRLLMTRENVFHEYHEAAFESAFSEFFEIIEKMPVQNSKRTIFWMRRKS